MGQFNLDIAITLTNQHNDCFVRNKVAAYITIHEKYSVQLIEFDKEFISETDILTEIILEEITKYASKN